MTRQATSTIQSPVWARVCQKTPRREDGLHPARCGARPARTSWEQSDCETARFEEYSIKRWRRFPHTTAAPKELFCETLPQLFQIAAWKNSSEMSPPC